MTLPPSPLMTTQEVATYFRCTTRTIRNWVRAGLLHPTRIQRTLFFRRTDVELLAADDARDANPEPFHILFSSNEEASSN